MLATLSLKRQRATLRSEVFGWSSPRTCLLPSTDYCMRDKASVVRPKASNVYARLCMLVNVFGCSSPSVLFLASSTLSRKSALHPAASPGHSNYINGRLFMVVNVPGCSSPASSFLPSAPSLADLHLAASPGHRISMPGCSCWSTCLDALPPASSSLPPAPSLANLLHPAASPDHCMSMPGCSC